MINDEIDYVEILLTCYGLFRHWDHPFIDYHAGLAINTKNGSHICEVCNVNFARKYVLQRHRRIHIGLPYLFTWTHEIFERSLTYYKDRPDLMEIGEVRLIQSKKGFLVCWQGQAEALEELRQKGWSVVNLLLIERESKR